jgi:hypothetical protein
VKITASAFARERLSSLRASAARTASDALRLARPVVRRVWPPGPRHGAAMLAAGVVGLGLFGMAFQSALPEQLPAPIDWRSAAALLARDARPGDAVALAPWWAERGREVLPASLPVMAFPRLAGEDLLGVHRVWLVELPRAPGYRYDLEDDLMARAGAVEGPQRLGALEVTRYDLRSPTLPLAFLPDRLATAEVSMGARPCVQDARGVFRCASPSVLVSREVREVDGLPRPCLYAQPSADPGAPLVITFRDVPIGRWLRGHTGIVGEAALAGDAPVRVKMMLDAADLGAAEEPPMKPGWHLFQVDTAQESGRVRTLTFTLTSAASQPRPLCLDAYTLP